MTSISQMFRSIHVAALIFSCLVDVASCAFISIGTKIRISDYPNSVMIPCNRINYDNVDNKSLTIHLIRRRLKYPDTDSSIDFGKKKRNLKAIVPLFALTNENGNYENDDDDDDDDFIEVKDDDVRNFQKDILSAKLSKSKASSFGLGKGRSAPSQRKAMGRSSAGRATVYVCTNCGSEFIQSLGKCPTCGEWNTIQPFQIARSKSGVSSKTVNKKSPNKNHRSWLEDDESYHNDYSNDEDDWLHDDNDYSDDNHYTPLNPESLDKIWKEDHDCGNYEGEEQRLVLPDDQEWNTVLGGGIVPGSLLLLGGEPGVGKSTLLLQVASQVASTYATNGKQIGMSTKNIDNLKISRGPVLYVSGEETARQIASRARRLQLGVFKNSNQKSNNLELVCETNANSIAKYIHQHKPTLVILDSIQTLYRPDINSSPGSVRQVRECVALFLRLAKSTNVPILLVGHVTKTGSVAGPKTVEHMVDAVLSLDSSGTGSINNNVKWLRASKNRFGNTRQVGMYQTSVALNGQLVPITDDPTSALSLLNNDQNQDLEGCAMAMIIQGLRSLPIEVQVLVAQSTSPRKSTTAQGGVTPSRINLLLAVLSKRFGLYPLSRCDVYINIVGVLNNKKANDSNGLDVAVVVAMVSSFTNIATRADTCFVGEIGLLGELRFPSNTNWQDEIHQRIKEARQMGFSRIVTPAYQQRSTYEKRSPISKSKPKYIKQDDGVIGMEWIQCRDVVDVVRAGLVSEIPYYRSKQGQKRFNPSIWRKQKHNEREDIDDTGLDEIIADKDMDIDNDVRKNYDGDSYQ